MTLDGSGSSDPDGTIASYEWKDANGSLLALGVNPLLLLNIGTHVITLRVTDDDGQWAEDTVTITVQADAEACTPPAGSPAPIGNTVSDLISAINAANANSNADVIVLPAHTTYTLTASDNSSTDGANGLPVITTPITIYGNCSIIQRDASAPQFRILKVDSGGSLTLHYTRLSGGDAGENLNGGGVLNAGSLTLRKVEVMFSYASADGGGIYNTGTLDIWGSPIQYNGAVNNGGGVYNTGTFTADYSGFIGNESGSHGGGVYNTGAFTVSASGFIANAAMNSGGGLYNTAIAPVSISTSGINQNFAVNGGGVYNTGSNLSITTSGFDGNISTADGGGLYNTGTLTFTMSNMNYNNSVNGGGVYNTGTLTINNTGVDDNVASGNGGGLYNTGANTVSFNGVGMNRNSAAAGGGIYNAGSSLAITGSGLFTNTASATGGGFHNTGTVTMNYSGIVLNTSAGNGGGLYSDNNAQVIDSSIIENTSDGTGGGVYTVNASPNAIYGNCIDGNTAVDTGGLYSAQATLYAGWNSWGSVDGPSGAGTGTGDAVNAHVNYEEFLTTDCSQPALVVEGEGTSAAVLDGVELLTDAAEVEADSNWQFDSAADVWTFQPGQSNDENILEISDGFDLRLLNNPKLSFMQQATLAPYDIVLVEVFSPYANNWLPLDWQQGLQTDWSTREIDLTAYRNQSIRLRFRILTTGNEGEGTFSLDELTITDEVQLPRR